MSILWGTPGTIGRRVWAIVKPLSGRSARQTSLSPFDSGFFPVFWWDVTRGLLFYYFQTRRLLSLSLFYSLFFRSFLFSTWLNWAWQCWKRKKKLLQTHVGPSTLLDAHKSLAYVFLCPFHPPPPPLEGLAAVYQLLVYPCWMNFGGSLVTCFFLVDFSSCFLYEIFVLDEQDRAHCGR